MYKIMNENTTLAVLTAPAWVRLQDNGSFALCDESAAHGVAIDGTVYHVSGRPEIADRETVVIGEISETAYQAEQKAAQDEQQLQNETAMAELSILLASLMGG